MNKVRFILVEEFLSLFLTDTSSIPCLSSPPVFPKWGFTITVIKGLIIISIKLIVLLSSNLPNALKLQYKKA